jgi:hypothetical protein
MREISEITQARLRAAVVAIAPVVVLIGFLYAPYVGDLTDSAAAADGVADDTTRWAWSRMVQVVGLALLPLLVFSVRSYLKAAGEQLWSFLAAPLVTVGAVLFAYITGLELGLAPVVEAGASAEAVIDATDPWFIPTLLVAAVIFGLGWLSLAAAIYRSKVLSRELTWVVIAALVALTVAIFIPTGWAFYVIGVGAIVASWPIAYQMWLETTETPVAAAGPAPA